MSLSTAWTLRRRHGHRGVRLRAFARTLVLSGAVLGPLHLVGAASATPDEDAARHGRRLYHHGLNREGGEITAWVGANASLPGTLAACARCHGVSGRGSRDAGLQVPSLRWAELTQARAAQPGLLARAAYDETSLIRAIREGLDSEGRPLAAAMPRFELSPRAAADLVHHLRRLGTEHDAHPGVQAQIVRLGTVLPAGAAASPTGAALLAATRACLDRANREGGVHGRQLELKVFEGETASAERGASDWAPPWLDEVLMLVAPWWPQTSAAQIARQLGPVPVLGPMGAASELTGASPWWFGVVPVPSDQVRIAVDRIAASGARGRILVVVEPGVLGQAASAAAQSQAALHPGLNVREVVWRSPASAQAELSQALRESDAPAALIAPLGAAALRTVADALERHLSDRPTLLYALATQAGAQPLSWPAALRARVRLLSASVAEGDFNPRSFEADLAAQGSPHRLPAIQAPAYAAGCAAVEALRRAGRDLDRERLVEALVAIQRFSTGVMPPLSFGPRQRHGVWHSRVLRVDAQGRGFEPESGWESPRQPL